MAKLREAVEAAVLPQLADAAAAGSPQKNVDIVVPFKKKASRAHQAHDDPRRNKSARATKLGRPWKNNCLGRVCAPVA
jgi:hypothetical protein